MDKENNNNGAVNNNLEEKINYKIVKDDDNSKPVIIKKDTPNVRLNIVKGLSVTPAQLKKYKERTIFVDGVYNGAPFVNNEKQIYSLDHHEGIIRNFTLSSCEQALIMVMKGLTLDEGTWNIYVNEPDLDAVLSIWVLCNYRELIELKETILQKTVRLVRVEGIIDVHGFTMSDFTGYASSTFDTEKEIIDKLMEQERILKGKHEWNKIDYTKYTMLMLGKIDIVIYGQDKEKKKAMTIREIKNFSMRNSKYIIICESASGIYEVEESLKNKYPGKVGIIILRSSYDNKRYTLRLANDFISPDLSELYKELNKIDKAVTKSDEGNKWGGSENIGGSPRLTGSYLSPTDIEKACRKIYSKVSLWGRIKKKFKR